MQQILLPFACSDIIIYIDDILIMSKSFGEHLDMVRKVLNTLMLNGIKIKVTNCEFFKSEVGILCHTVSNEADLEKVLISP